MLKIEFNNTKLEIPSSWSDITLADYEQWFNVHPADKMEYIRLVADICKLDADVLLESPTQLFDVIAETIQFVFEPQVEPSHKVNIDGTDHFITLSDKLTLGEWVDIESTFDSASTTKISEVLAIVCRPAGEASNARIRSNRTETFRRTGMCTASD